MEVAETASHLQMFFFSQKSWSLISVLSKPTTQHHYSDFLLLPTNLPFIHCLKKEKKKQKTICSFHNPKTAYPNAHFSSSSDSLLWLPSSLLVTSFHPVHLPQSNCYGPSLIWIWENGIETCKISCVKRVASPGSMHDTGCLGLVHWDDPEGWYGEGGGR